MERVRKRSFWLIMGLMAVVFVSGIAMAQSLEFFVISVIGYALMTGISFLDYRKISTASTLLLAPALLVIFFLSIYFLKSDFFGWNHRERGSFLHVLSIASLFLYAVLLYKTIGKELQQVEISISLIFFGILLELCRVGGSFWVVEGSVFMMLWAVTQKKLLNWKKVRELVVSYPVIYGTATGMAAVSVIKIILLNKESIEVFFTKTGKRAYIYEVLTRFWGESKWIGKGFEKHEIVSWIPEYEGTCILTNYVASYGRIAGVFLVSLLLIVFVKVLYDTRDAELLGRILAVGSSTILFVEMLLVVLENLQIVPYISFSAYLPFYSQKAVSMICSYLLMGIILSVYRHGVSDEMCLNLY